MSIIFDIKIKQNQNQMNKIEKKQFKTKKTSKKRNYNCKIK
jgi:hypothetical protein